MANDSVTETSAIPEEDKDAEYFEEAAVMGMIYMFKYLGPGNRKLLLESLHSIVDESQ